MEDKILKQSFFFQFMARLSRNWLVECFERYLAVRIGDQWQVIANLVTVDSQQRLGKSARCAMNLFETVHY